MSRIAVATYCPQRSVDLLSEHVESVAAQTVKPKMHLISVDHRGTGYISEWNRLWRSVGCCVEWVAFVSAERVLPVDWLERLDAAVGPQVDYVVEPDDRGVSLPSLLRIEVLGKVGGIPGHNFADGAMVDLRRNLAGWGAKVARLDPVEALA